MKKKKYDKAMRTHQDLLAKYADEIHDTVDEMRRCGCTVAEAISLLEVEKLYRFNEAVSAATVQDVMDFIEALDGEEE